MSSTRKNVGEPYLWLQDDEDEAISDDGSVRLVASHEGSGPAVFVIKEAGGRAPRASRISVAPLGITVHFSRPRDDFDGPTLGPYEWVELTYQSLKVAPHGDEIAFFIDGAWVLTRDGVPDAIQHYSDLTFAPTLQGDKPEGGPNGR